MVAIPADESEKGGTVCLAQFNQRRKGRFITLNLSEAIGENQEARPGPNSAQTPIAIGIVDLLPLSTQGARCNAAPRQCIELLAYFQQFGGRMSMYRGSIQQDYSGMLVGAACPPRASMERAGSSGGVARGARIYHPTIGIAQSPRTGWRLGPLLVPIPLDPLLIFLCSAYAPTCVMHIAMGSHDCVTESDSSALGRLQVFVTRSQRFGSGSGPGRRGKVLRAPLVCSWPYAAPQEVSRPEHPALVGRGQLGCKLVLGSMLEGSEQTT